MDHCSYNTNHWPCTYCEAPNPKHVDAKCRNEEELYCPLCGERAVIYTHWADARYISICCENDECLYPETDYLLKEKAIEKWRKYAR